MKIDARNLIVVVTAVAYIDSKAAAFTPLGNPSSFRTIDSRAVRPSQMPVLHTITNNQEPSENSQWSRIRSIASLSKPRRFIQNKRGKLRKIFSCVALPASLWFKGPTAQANAIHLSSNKIKSEPLAIERAGYSKRMSISSALVGGTVAVVGSSVGGIVIKKRRDTTSDMEEESIIVDEEESLITDEEERKAEIARESLDDMVSKAFEKITAVDEKEEKQETNPITDDFTDDIVESINIPEEDEDMLAIEALTSVRAQAEAVLAAKAEEQQLESEDDDTEESMEKTESDTIPDYTKFDHIEDPGEKAFAILVDLGMVEVHPDPDDQAYDHSDDDEYVPEGVWI